MVKRRRNLYIVLAAAAMPLALLAILPSCAGLGQATPALPRRHHVVLEQLEIHSDFPLPQHHRMLDDLRSLRGSIQATLDLPSSDEPVHVYLFEDNERFQAFLRQHHPDFPTRRAFFVKSDTVLAVYAHWGDRVAEDLRHEVAHGYLHAVVPNIPLWLDEGLAEYFEVPRGGAGVNRPHVDLLVAQAKTAAWRPDLRQLERLASAAEMTQSDYAESWAWVYTMLESGTPQRQLLQRHLRSLREEGTVEPLSAQLERTVRSPETMVSEHLARLAPRN
jgi:hypothetical protein